LERRARWEGRRASAPPAETRMDADLRPQPLVASGVRSRNEAAVVLRHGQPETGEDLLHLDSAVEQDAGRGSGALGKEPGEEVLGADPAVSELPGLVLRENDDLPRLLREALKHACRLRQARRPERAEPEREHQQGGGAADEVGGDLGLPRLAAEARAELR